jgi:N-acetylmuramoyl-L-alanine amidase
MRRITHIVLHCTATPQSARVESIQRYWRERLGWRNPGYHWIIDHVGAITQLATDDVVANGVRGHNARSIHISYIGGVDVNGNAIDNRTPAQRSAMCQLVLLYRLKYPESQVLGHRDFPGVQKDCPSFDVAAWLLSIGINPDPTV